MYFPFTCLPSEMFALRAVVLLVRHVLVERAKERETDESLLSVCV